MNGNPSTWRTFDYAPCPVATPVIGTEINANRPMESGHIWPPPPGKKYVFDAKLHAQLINR
jgi:hypothetical protein